MDSGYSVYERRAYVAKALAHPTRLEILDMLTGQEEICVCAIAAALKQGQPTVSKHLSILREAGIVRSRKQGLQVFYALRAGCVTGFFECLDRVLHDDLEDKQEALRVGCSRE